MTTSSSSATAVDFITALTAPLKLPPEQFRFGKRSAKGVYATRGFSSPTAQYVDIAVYKPDAPEPNAKRQHCIGAWALVLDDIGTKCQPIEALKPTWIVETSPGNFQHGYALTKIAPVERAMSALRALAVAGHTDPGAATVPRWVRLPGRKHPSKDFTTRLVHAAGPRYTMRAVLRAAGAKKPAPLPERPELKETLAFPADDPVLAFFYGKDMLLAREAQSGWRDVRCPWINEHTADPENGAAILKIEGGYQFKCLHGHCAERSINDVYAWMRANGGAEVADRVDRFGEPEKIISATAELLRKAGVVSSVEPVVQLNGYPDYWAKLMRGDKGVLVNEENIALVLTLAPEWQQLFTYDEFTRRIRVARALPGTDEPARNFPRPPIDDDEIAALRWLQRTFKPFAKLKPSMVRAVWSNVLTATRINSCRDYVLGCPWDGTPRLHTLLAVGFGAEDTKLHAEIGKRWMISAVARVLSPGCQADHALIAIGEQGIGKSSAFKALGGEWFSDQMPAIGGNSDKDASMLLAENWIIEFAELDALRRARDISAVKTLITRREDKYRPPYGRAIIEQPRHCVFCGTVNPDGAAFLHDPTGGRRFWPFAASRVDIKWITTHRDQLWGEACALYKTHARWWLDARTDEQLMHELRDTQQEHTEQLSDTPLAAQIAQLVKGRTEPVQLAELLTVAGMDAGTVLGQRAAAMEAARALYALGWRKHRYTADGVRAWRWLPPTAAVVRLRDVRKLG